MTQHILHHFHINIGIDAAFADGLLDFVENGFTTDRVLPDRADKKHLGLSSNCTDPTGPIPNTFDEGLAIRALQEGGLVWRRGPDSNRWIRVLQTLALPLGYRATPT